MKRGDLLAGGILLYRSSGVRPGCKWTSCWASSLPSSKWPHNLCKKLHSGNVLLSGVFYTFEDSSLFRSQLCLLAENLGRFKSCGKLILTLPPHSSSSSSSPLWYANCPSHTNLYLKEGTRCVYVQAACWLLQCHLHMEGNLLVPSALLLLDLLTRLLGRRKKKQVWRRVKLSKDGRITERPSFFPHLIRH